MNGGSTRLWSGVQCSVMRRRLKDLGEFPNCLTTGSKTARCTAPWVGFSVLVSKGSHPEEGFSRRGICLNCSLHYPVPTIGPPVRFNQKSQIVSAETPTTLALLKSFRAHVPPPSPPRKFLSSHLRIHGGAGSDRGPAGDLQAGEKKWRRSRRHLEPRHHRHPVRNTRRQDPDADRGLAALSKRPVQHDAGGGRFFRRSGSSL